MTSDEIVALARPRDDDPVEIAEIRDWLRSRDPSELWGLTPATRIAMLLHHIERNRTAIRDALAFGRWQGQNDGYRGR